MSAEEEATTGGGPSTMGAGAGGGGGGGGRRWNVEWFIASVCHEDEAREYASVTGRPGKNHEGSSLTGWSSE